MFIPFFLELKAARVPVSLREYLTLLEGMDARLVDYDVEGFYYLARAALVKDERHIDRFDQVFSHIFKGVEAVSGEGAVDVANIPEEWLRRLAEKHLSEDEKKLIETMGGFDKLMETLKKRLEEQKGRHQGGSKWIGTAGTSPFGAYGYNPEGVRIGQHESRHRRAVKVWDKREFKNFDDSIEIGTRNIKVALKRLRRWVREGANEELDLPGTIHATAEHGYLDVQTRSSTQAGRWTTMSRSSRNCFRPRAPSSANSNISTSTTVSTRAFGRTTAVATPRCCRLTTCSTNTATTTR
jgi:hypothetical protein